MLPDSALLLHPCDVWQALLALFLLYRKLLSNHKLFTDCELHDARTLALPHVTLALRVASSARSFSIVP